MEPVAEAAAPLSPTKQEIKPVASYLHTFLIVLLMLGVGMMSAASFKKGTAPTNPLALYIPTIIWLWSLGLLTYLGMRFRGTPLREVFGRTWQSFDDFLMDIVVAAGFWLGAFGVIVALALVFNALTHAPKPTGLPPEFQALAPRGVAGILTWIVLSITAGICEEFVFRGYLQRQFSALTRSPVGGIILSACIFSFGHLYEGAVKAVIIGIFGILLGILAYMRRSLAPGMIAHTWHDVFSGFLLSILGRVVK
jgi:membrane protease YdiL (CAAX protease family)